LQIQINAVFEILHILEEPIDLYSSVLNPLIQPLRQVTDDCALFALFMCNHFRKYLYSKAVPFTWFNPLFYRFQTTMILFWDFAL